MKVVYKYEIGLLKNQSIMLPKGYEILSFQEQNDKLFIWCLIDPLETIFNRLIFDVFATGEEIINEIKRQYIGTTKLENNIYVFHLFKQLP